MSPHRCVELPQGAFRLGDSGPGGLVEEPARRLAVAVQHGQHTAGIDRLGATSPDLER